jgi:hypothetical protein
MPPRAVAGQVDEHPVAGLGGAHAESIELTPADHERQAGGAPSAPSLCQTGVHGVKVHVPRSLVVANQDRRAAVLGEEMVRLQRGSGDVTVAAQLEHDPQLVRQMDKGVDGGGREPLVGQRTDLTGARPPGATVGWHLVSTRPVDAWGEVVDERRGDEHDVISV